MNVFVNNLYILVSCQEKQKQQRQSGWTIYTAETFQHSKVSVKQLQTVLLAFVTIGNWPNGRQYIIQDRFGQPITKMANKNEFIILSYMQ